MNKCFVKVLCIISFIIALPLLAQAQVDDFSFLQISDIHIPSIGGGSERQLASLTALHEITMSPYGITAPSPAFMIATGDITEFGGGYGNAWNTATSLLKNIPIPVYLELGNHDTTWGTIRTEIEAKYGHPYYSFDAHGAHFIGLDSTGMQDPRPGFSEEEIRWLREDLKKVGPSMPVFVYFHHPYRSTEAASDYDWDRLADTLRPYNIVLLLVGHGHQARYRRIDGFDEVEGGNTYQPGNGTGSAGYMVIFVQHNTLRVAYKLAGEANATIPILQKSMPTGPQYPTVAIQHPFVDQKVNAHRENSILSLSATITLPASQITSAIYEIDTNERDVAGNRGTLTPYGRAWAAEVSPRGLLSGEHYCRFTFTDIQGVKYHKSVRFFVENGIVVQTRWRTFLSGSSRSTPAIANGMLYVGDNDGKLYAGNARIGALSWIFTAGGEIYGQPLIAGDYIIIGTTEGKLFSVNKQGKPVWTRDLHDPILSSPVLADGLVLSGGRSGKVYAVDPATGEVKWEKQVAGYTIEAKPSISQSMAYFSAWDGKIYALNLKDPSVKWGAMSAGATEQPASRYYSPADSTPVVAGDRVFVADRDYMLTILNANTGEVIASQPNCSAVGLAEDGKSVYLRKTDGSLVKATLDGTPIWSVQVDMDDMPTAPVEINSIVYAISSHGLLSAISAAEGKVRWQYQITPQLYTYSSPVVQDGVVYIVGGDGSVTALRLPRRWSK